MIYKLCLSKTRTTKERGVFMRRVTVCSSIVVMAILFLISFATAAEKLGYVDLSRIFNEYNKTKKYDRILEDRQKAYDTEREKKVNEVKQIRDSMNLVSEKEKKSKESLLEKKVKDLQDFDREKTQDLRKERDEKMKEILKDIESTITEYAKRQGYTLVFNDRVLVYQEKSLDITDDILKTLQSNYSE